MGTLVDWKRTLITPTIIAHEMAMLADAEGRPSNLVIDYSITDDAFRGLWWCDGRAVEIGPYSAGDLALSLDAFGAEFLAPAVEKWKAGEGRKRDAYGLPHGVHAAVYLNRPEGARL